MNTTNSDKPPRNPVSRGGVIVRFQGPPQQQQQQQSSEHQHQQVQQGDTLIGRSDGPWPSGQAATASDFRLGRAAAANSRLDDLSQVDCFDW